MPIFASKAAPQGDKLRGGYYTPDVIAEFVAAWVAAAGPATLEPSCGDGGILGHLVRHSHGAVEAVELFADEANKAEERTGVAVHVGDFFQWFTSARYGRYDGVAGNPPYIRFGTWDEPYRQHALDFMRTQGLRPSKLMNAWVPFVVAAVTAVRQGGRVGLVLPAELLQVGYAAALRSHLVDRCSSITVVSFKRLVFPGILQEVVLLLAERGQGPAEIRTVEVDDAASLVGMDLGTAPAARAALHESEKWTKYYLDIAAIEALRRVRTDGRLQPLSTYAEVDVGVVTGRNAFFCLTEAEALARGLEPWTTRLVSRSQQVAGLIISEDDFALHEKSELRTRLLTLTAQQMERPAPKLATYVQVGEFDGVPEGYKCRVRRNWWEVPSAWKPDGFMLRQISSHPRMAFNAVGATSTDTVHRVRVRDGVDMQNLAAGAYNSVSFALAEILGRSYGGGILEMEPTECEHWPVPDPAMVPAGLAQKADELIRERRFEDALDLIDNAVLVEQLGFDPAEVATMRTAWVQLRDRRSARGKR